MENDYVKRGSYVDMEKQDRNSKKRGLLEPFRIELPGDFYLSPLSKRIHFLRQKCSVDYESRILPLEGWEDWFNSQRPTPEEEKLMSQTTKARNRSEKQSPLKPERHLAVIVNADGLPKDVEELKREMVGKKFLLDIKGVSEDMTQEVIIIGEENEFVGKVERYFLKLEEFNNEDVLVVCRSYFSFLERAIDKCDRAFEGVKSFV